VNIIKIKKIIDGHLNICKNCHSLIYTGKTYREKYNKINKKENNIHEKCCSRCFIFKNIKEFVKKHIKNNNTVYRSICKTCFNLRKYNISSKDYLYKLKNQNGLCKICGSDNDGKTLCIDHDHNTGIVRDLLCNNCNLAIGLFGDNISNIENSLNYLNYHNNFKRGTKY
jgi:hypothetical protein